MSRVISNGLIVTASEKYVADILIRGEKIAAIGRDLAGQAETVVDAGGKYVFPGGIDAHTHFRLPFMGTYTRGFDTTRAAVAGGTTCIVDFAPQPVGMKLMEAIAKHRAEEAEGKSASDYAFHAMVMDAQDFIFEEPEALVKAGIPTIKIFMAYKGTPFFTQDDIIFRMMRKAKDVGMTVMLHAENGHIIDELQKKCLAEGKTEPKYHAVTRPEVAEAEAATRATMLAEAAGAPVFIVHVSCTEAMEAVRNAQIRGVAAYGETCPHYLVLDVDNLAKPNFEGAKYVCSPPLRASRHQDHLWAALQHGWLRTVGSDHCGFNFKSQKEMGREAFTKIPNGAPGVENRLAILYTYGVLKGKISLERMVDVFATAPAKFNGLYPRKGSIAVGADADLVVFDPNYTGVMSAQTSLQGVDFNAYEGFEQKGRADQVYLRGNLMVDGGRFVGNPSGGKFIERSPFGLAYENAEGPHV